MSGLVLDLENSIPRGRGILSLQKNELIGLSIV